MNPFDESVSDKALAQKVVNLLADRELECFLLCAQGFSTKQAAVKMNIAYTTASTYRERSRAKLGLPTHEAVVIMAWRTRVWIETAAVIRQSDKPLKELKKPIDNVDN